METEKIIKPANGFGMFILLLVLLGVSIVLYILRLPALAGPLNFISFFIMFGFIVVNPNQSSVLTFFGKYVGTVKQNGFFWTNPFYAKKKISLRARNFDTDQLKVNDKMGNPILIGAVLVWQVEDTYKAAFSVNNYEEFVRIQTDSALRQMASSYAYDNFEDEHANITLRSSGDEINNMLEQQIVERLVLAGIKVIEARISHLSYAPEIAGAMLQRQQATAIVAARHKIVEGAVGMVEMALHELSVKKIIELDDEKKAAMVSNLMVVLCSDKNAQPVVNTGTLYQ